LFTESSVECGGKMRGGGYDVQKPNHPQCRLLRPRYRRPRHRTPKTREELSPPHPSYLQPLAAAYLGRG